MIMILSMQKQTQKKYNKCSHSHVNSHNKTRGSIDIRDIYWEINLSAQIQLNRMNDYL